MKVLRDLDAFKNMSSPSILGKIHKFSQLDAATMLGIPSVFTEASKTGVLDGLIKSGSLSAFESVGRVRAFSAIASNSENFDAFYAIVKDTKNFNAFSSIVSDSPSLKAFEGIGGASRVGAFEALGTGSAFGNVELVKAFASVRMVADLPDPSTLFAELEPALRDASLAAAADFAEAGVQSMIESLDEVESASSDIDDTGLVSLDFSDPNVRLVIGIGVAFWAGLAFLGWQLNNPELVTILDNSERSLVLSLFVFAVITGRRTS